MTDENTAARQAELTGVFEMTAPRGFRDTGHVWGEFMEAAIDETTLLRDIIVYPGGRTSIHRHRHHSEIDVVVGGAVAVWLGPTVDTMERQVVERGGLFVVPVGMYHAVGFVRGERSGQPCARFYEVVHAFHSAEDIERHEPAVPGERLACAGDVLSGGLIRDALVAEALGEKALFQEHRR